MQTTPDHKLHVAIIMDGNGRWAEARGLPRPAGHQVGADAVRAIVRSAITRGIGALSLYAFSSYNWRRSEAEVAGMMALLRHFLLVEARQLRDANVRISILGRRDRLPLGLVKAIAAAERSTAGCTGLHLRVAIDYSARDAILAAAAAGPDAIAAELGTEDVDFLIRTGGDQRLSDFMLWECAQAELYFTRVKWPDFGPAEFDTALAEYAGRVRSFGGNVEPMRAMAG
ncbi:MULTISPECIES: polyprenyl diphosphate synthase [unclassified Devosia]|uniref:polyprenyl diphosphate synthase n=1 Tax=unclassified Devosia TaxID=196773 RepID=UPI0008689159|nr:MULTISPECIES: polyprenyl diphosphate synthase [unclassified Devosia]MBN9363981.1 di-trans,poly-cis-decaprenylcistransferase [Devosia sp.]ODS80709.1 MAG: di-trans,poly-cis-decaprenylcistransferase [Devosia sp. SCN 66-27]OJX27243.1 MAG: di-trans,poly-cis-decaprenylcistransferase [Devosia sp. 66-14]